MGEPLLEMFLTTDYGRILYKKWLSMRKKACISPEFIDFRGFYDWSIESGYSYGDSLMRRDSTLPFSPQNCYWMLVDKKRAFANEGAERDWALKWNKTVNSLRRYYGLPLFEEEGVRKDG